MEDFHLLNPYNDVSTGGGKKYVKAERKNEALSEEDLIIQK
ncbi:hypothetical protein [Staphylococcus warneri]|nr:hypothetical protein [Staphylococcus warneri]